MCIKQSTIVDWCIIKCQTLGQFQKLKTNEFESICLMIPLRTNWSQCKLIENLWTILTFDVSDNNTYAFSTRRLIFNQIRSLKIHISHDYNADRTQDTFYPNSIFLCQKRTRVTSKAKQKCLYFVHFLFILIEFSNLLN